MSGWHLGNWSVSVPNCISVSWQVCWSWHIFWQCLVNDSAWVKSPAMFAHLPKWCLSSYFWQIRHNRRLSLIGLWGSCKTKAANLSARVWTVLASEYFLSLWACVQQKFEEKKIKTWQSHFRCSDVTQPFWLKSSLNMRFGLLWCEVSSDAILACYLPAVLCHPLLQRLTWELPELRFQPFIPGDYKLKIWGR